MAILEKLTAIDPSQLQGSTFDKLNYINTIWINIAFQVALILLPLLLWFFWGLGKGYAPRKMRIQSANYWFFIVLLLIQFLIIIIYDFPFWLLMFE